MQICAGDFLYVVLISRSTGSSSTYGESGCKNGLSFDPSGLYDVTRKRNEAVQKFKSILSKGPRGLHDVTREKNKKTAKREFCFNLYI